jgi:integrase
MRALMGLIKDRHGTYYAQQKVPDRLQVAVARYLGNGKPKQVYQKKSLGTKDLRTANVRAKPVLAQFDRVLREAAALTTPRAIPPLRSNLNAAEIARMSEALYGKLLADDEAFRFGGRARIGETVEWIRRNENPDYQLPYPIESVREHGWHPEQLARQKEHMVHELATMQEALALGDITAVQDDVSLLLADFEINLDRKSAAYRELGMQALRAYVRALLAIDKRNAGEPIETPEFTRGPVSSSVADGGTLRNAIAGWEKERARPTGTIYEYKRAVELFIQLHGDMQVAKIKKSHAREFREALQLVPRARSGHLKDAKLPELAEWGRKHPEVLKVSAGTVNKQLGAVQAIAGWAHHNGVIPDDVPWADPFQKMRVEEELSSRGPFDPRELQKVFNAPLFTANEEPEGAKGPAGAWLPLLALFTGARRGEIAALRVENVRTDEATRTPLLFIVADRKTGKRVKTKASERVVPVHPQLVALGFLKYVEGRARDEEGVWLFPAVAPDQGRALSAWGKWWSRYLRQTVGIGDADRVFHSFRHGFQDALRRATPDEELRDALSGRSNHKSVGRTYGAKNMLERWGAAILTRAISNISYPGLDLSRVKPLRVPTRKRSTRRA